MNEDKFNMSLRKFLKQVGVTSQREIERVVRENGLDKGKLKVQGGADRRRHLPQPCGRGGPRPRLRSAAGRGVPPMHLEDPRFPPLLKGHPVRAPRQPFAHACGLAQTAKLGAGDVVWSRNTGRAQLAIVLEPEVALERALQMGPLMMVALGDSLGSLCPPKVAVQYRWPGSLLLNGSVAGNVRLAAPRAPANSVPAWMVVGADLDIAAPRKDRQDFSATSLDEEAGPGITRTDLLQSLAAHFMAHLNTWQDEGFRPVHDRWLFRAEGREAPTRMVHGDAGIEGQVLGLDESAGLLVRTNDGKVRSLAFLDSVDLVGPAAPR